MKLLETYSLISGQKIDKIHTNEKFFAIPFEKYIVFAPFSKQSKNYSYWFEVLSSIGPVLEKNGIRIVQVGAANEEKMPFCYHTQGTTNWGQLQYLISKSILVLSTDTAAAHLAGHYNKPLVDLISNNFSACVRPFYGDSNNQIIIEPDRTNKNPTFQLDEGDNKQIDEIKPESIIYAVLKLLGVDLEVQYLTLYIGREYKYRIIESYPDTPINISNLGIQALIVRMDFNFNEPVLFQQLQHCKCSIVTDQPINPELLSAARANIVEVVYNIKDSPIPNAHFCKLLFDLKIPCRLVSWMTEDKINPYKIDFMNWGIICEKTVNPIPAIKPEDIKSGNVFFKSRRYLLGRTKIYQTYSSFIDDNSIADLSPTMELVTEQNFERLLIEQDNLYFLKKNY